MTVTGFNSTAGSSYYDVFEEVGKYHIHLNWAERLWVVRVLSNFGSEPILT